MLTVLFAVHQVSGVGVQNPYRIRPFLGAKVPVNSSYSPVISMYNPHGSVLQVCYYTVTLTNMVPVVETVKVD